MLKRHKDLLRAVVGKLRRVLAGAAGGDGAWERGDLDRELERIGVAPDGTTTPLDALPSVSRSERRAHNVADAALRPLPVGERAAARERLVERAAYTWINRLLALRAMEARGLIEETLRANSEYGGVSEALFVLRQVAPARATGQDAGWWAVIEEACRAQGASLPGVFDLEEPTASLRPSARALLRCVATIGGAPAGAGLAEADAAFADPDAIGWAYQFYQEAAKSRVYAKLGSGGKAETREEIAAATQLFTEPYMVRWLLENSLGRAYHEAYPDSALPAAWAYDLRDRPLAGGRRADTGLDELTVMDPAVGSGHFLRVAFDMLASMYRERHPELGAVEVADRILGRHLYGVDIDPRAGQLAALTLYLRARELVRDERRARRQPGPGEYRPPALNIATTPTGLESGALVRHLRRHPGDEVLKPLLEGVFAALERADVLGSLLQPGEQIDAAIAALQRPQARMEFDADAANLRRTIGELARHDPAELRRMLLERVATSLAADVDGADEVAALFGREAGQGVRLIQLLERRYAVVVTNPPYMGSGSLDSSLKAYVQKAYPAGRADLYAAFIARCRELCRPDGRVAMVTQQSWMFLRSFVDLRACAEEDVPTIRRRGGFTGVLRDTTVEALAHLGAGAFGEISGEVVQSVLFVLRNREPDAAHRIETFRLIGPKSPIEKDELLRQAIGGHAPGARFRPVQARLLAIPQSPLCYWLRERFFELLMGRTLSDVAEVKQGLATADDKRFVRFTWEVPSEQFRAGVSRRWVPLEKGGGYGKWFGHQWWAVDWAHDGGRIKASPTAVIRNEQYYFRAGWTYSRIARGSLGIRVVDDSAIFSDHSSLITPFDGEGVAVILDSPLSSFVVRSINAKIDLRESYVGRIPFPSTIPHELHAVETACVALKKGLVAADPTERSFRVGLAGADDTAAAAALHALEGVAHRRALDLYQLGPEDVQAIVDETGTPAGWHPLVTGYDRPVALPPSHEAAELVLRAELDEHPRLKLEPAALVRLKANLRALFEAGPGARQADTDEPTDAEGEEEGDDAVVGGHVPIPPETFLEEMAQKLRVHPISVYRLLEELRAEGARCRPEELRAVEDRLSVLLLRLLGHRWPTQVREGEPVPGWADADGIVPLTPGTGEPTAAERLRERLRAEAGALGAQRTEGLLEELTGLTLEEWTRRQFFTRHVKQFRYRPIAWQLASAPAGGARRGSQRRPAFECLLYAHAAGADALARVRTRYVEPLLLAGRRRVEEMRAARDETAAAIATERIGELEGFAARLRLVEATGFAGAELDAAASSEPLDRWSGDGYVAPASREALRDAERAWRVDPNDGVRVNIAPLQLAGLLAADVLKAADAKKAIADRARWRADERRWVREGKLPRCGWMGEEVPESARWTELAPRRTAERVRLEQKRREALARAGAGAGGDRSGLGRDW